MLTPLDSNQTTILENLAKLLRKNAEQQFGVFLSVDGVKCENSERPSTPILGHVFGAIIVQGSDFRLTLKIYSDMKPLRPLCAKNLMTSEENVGEPMIRDFLREIANLFGGSMRTVLAHNRVDSGISLPLSSRGFDDVFFLSTNTSRTFNQIFKLSWPAGSLYISQFIEITAWDSLQPMLNYNPDAPVIDEAEDMFT